MPGDIVVSIDGYSIGSFAELQRFVATSAGKQLQIVVDRAGSLRTLTATPEQREVKDGFGNSHRIGVLGLTRSMAPEDVKTEKVGPLQALWMGVEETWFVIDRTFSYLSGVIAGQQSADQFGGPIRIAQVSGQVAAAGITPLLHLAAVLSVSIGLLNLFPVPLLDGGHLLFYAIEAIRGRPLSERAQEFGFRVGLALVAMLMIFATYNDIRNLAPS
jgi:regulator of sigma E protease